MDNKISDIHRKQMEKGIPGSVALQNSGLTKEYLKSRMEEGDPSASVLLLLGMTSNLCETWIEDFEDEDTGKTIPIERTRFLEDRFVFEPDPKLMISVEDKFRTSVKDASLETLRMWRDLFERYEFLLIIMSELADRDDADALEWMGNYYAGNYSSDPSFVVNKEKARKFYDRALSCGLEKDAFDWDLERLEFGLDWHQPKIFYHLYYDIYKTPSDWLEDCVYHEWIELFPSPMLVNMNMYDRDVVNCTEDDLKQDLLFRGVPESAFTPYKQGLLVNLRHLSFYIVTGPEDERCMKEGQLGVAPHLMELGPDQDHYFMSEPLLLPKEIADSMFNMNDCFPEIKWNVAKLFDDYYESRTLWKNEAVIYLGSIFEGKVPEDIVDARIAHEVRRIRHKGPYVIQKTVVIELYTMRLPAGKLTIDYELFFCLNKDFFRWYLSSAPEFDEIDLVKDETAGDEHLVFKYYGKPIGEGEQQSIDVQRFMAQTDMDSKSYGMQVASKYKVRPEEEKAARRGMSSEAEIYVRNLCKDVASENLPSVDIEYRNHEYSSFKSHYAVILRFPGGNKERVLEVRYDLLPKLNGEFLTWYIGNPQLPSGQFVLGFDAGLGKEMPFLEHEGYTIRIGTPPTVYR